jgi:hypothetical protein
MDKEQAEAAAEAILGAARQRQLIASGHISRDGAALNWIAIGVLALLGGGVGAFVGALFNHLFLGLFLGLIAGVVSGTRRRQA